LGDNSSLRGQSTAHKIRYQLKNRDPEFDRKMQEVLMVYRDVSLYNKGAVHDARPNPIYTVTVVEKPGVQAYPERCRKDQCIARGLSLQQV